MRICICFIACLFGRFLAAETIENVEFQFPASIYDWVLLTDTRALDDDPSCYAKIYTHRAGEALEIFTTLYASDNLFDDDEEEEEDEPLGLAETLLNELMMPYFPNHQFSLTQVRNTDEEEFFEWAMNDGFQPIMHGLIRVLKKEDKEVALSYATTASKNDNNIALWKDTLYEAQWID